MGNRFDAARWDCL